MRYHLKHLSAILAVVIYTSLTGPADAQDKENSGAGQVLYDAQEIIDRCEHLSDDFLAGNVADVFSGHVETAACLKEAILTHMKAMFDLDVLTPAYSDWMLTGMAHPTAELYWFLWTSHKKCGCGEETEAVHAEAVVTLYKSLLRDVIYQRNAYHL